MASESKVIVGLSGGVDSSLSAWLLQQQGYLVEGFFMKNWEDDSAECPATQDLLDVMKICDHLNIHLHAENFSQDYADRVFKNFIEEYEQGRTPNPDILCNREIKFDVLLQKAQQLGADFFATGHYAKLTHSNTQNSSTTELHRAADENKDQSYFLYALSQKQLANTLFPLEDWHKPQVRKKARELGLITHNKKDSTGICFIGNKKFQTFFKDYTHTKKGEIIDPNNKVLGTHMGVAFYTIGQRKGLGIGGQKNGSQEPWYVCEKNVKTNQLRIAQGENHPLLNHHHLSAHQLNWINQPPCPTNKSITARIRHRQPLQPLQIIELSTTKDTLSVRFQAPQFAIAAGQSIVLYQGTQCLGGGIIKERW